MYFRHEGNRKYRVSYHLRDKGDYLIFVKWGDDHIPGSPFHVQVWSQYLESCSLYRWILVPWTHSMYRSNHNPGSPCSCLILIPVSYSNISDHKPGFLCTGLILHRTFHYTDERLPNPVEFHGNQLTIKCYNFYDFNDFSMSLISHLGNKIYI